MQEEWTYCFDGTRDGLVDSIGGSLGHQHGSRACIDCRNGSTDIDLSVTNGHACERELQYESKGCKGIGFQSFSVRDILSTFDTTAYDSQNDLHSMDAQQHS